MGKNLLFWECFIFLWTKNATNSAAIICAPLPKNSTTPPQNNDLPSKIYHNYGFPSKIWQKCSKILLQSRFPFKILSEIQDFADLAGIFQDFAGFPKKLLYPSKILYLQDSSKYWISFQDFLPRFCSKIDLKSPFPPPPSKNKNNGLPTQDFLLRSWCTNSRADQLSRPHKMLINK